MRNLNKVVMAIAMFATATVFAANEPVKKQEVKKDNNEKSEEALYCKVTTKEGDIIECYLCDCSKLAESLQKSDN